MFIYSRRHFELIFTVCWHYRENSNWYWLFFKLQKLLYSHKNGKGSHECSNRNIQVLFTINFKKCKQVSFFLLLSTGHFYQCHMVMWHCFYPYPSGSLHWHWGNPTIAPVSYDCPSAREATLNWVWINTSRAWKFNRNKTKHNKSVHIFVWYCILFTDYKNPTCATLPVLLSTFQMACAKTNTSHRTGLCFLT